MNKRSPDVPNRIRTSLLLLLASLGLLTAAQRSTAFADWYTANVYRVLASVIGRFFGLFPFSFAELALYAAVLFWIGRLVRAVRLSLPCLHHAIKNHASAHGTRAVLCAKEDEPSREQDAAPVQGYSEEDPLGAASPRTIWGGLARSFLRFASLLFFSYTLCCGINYGHSSFADTSGLQPASYSTEELTALCSYLTEEVNRLAPEMPRAADGTALMKPEGSDTADIPGRAQKTLRRLGSLYPEMEGYYPRPKPLLFSYILSVQNLTGIYSPFTVEANYNRDMTGYNQPFTACHELSHLRGYMQEEEANYLAFLACIHSEYTDFQYSGYLSGWLYATNQLYRADYETYIALLDSLDQGARADLAANDAFWQRYDGRVAEVANQINDNYLKANGQSMGVASYGRMVDLMLAYYEENLSPNLPQDTLP